MAVRTNTRHQPRDLQKSGNGVKTSIWFTFSDGLVFVLTAKNTCKAPLVKNTLVFIKKEDQIVIAIQI
ncbi:MAG: hypothetical protein ACKO7Y_06345 [Candidatus Nitrosotenuis sp.]